MKISVNRISPKTMPVTAHIAVGTALTASGDRSREFTNPLFLNMPDKLLSDVNEDIVCDCVLSTEYINMNVGTPEHLVRGIYHKNIPDKYIPTLKDYTENSCIEFEDGIILVDERYKSHYDEENKDGSAVSVNLLFSFNLLEIVS